MLSLNGLASLSEQLLSQALNKTQPHFIFGNDAEFSSLDLTKVVDGRRMALSCCGLEPRPRSEAVPFAFEFSALFAKYPEQIVEYIACVHVVTVGLLYNSDNPASVMACQAVQQHIITAHKLAQALNTTVELNYTADVTPHVVLKAPTWIVV